MKTKLQVGRRGFVGTAGMLLLLLLLFKGQLQASSTVQFRASTSTVSENAGTVTLTVLRAGDTNTLVSVDYATSDINAKAGVDYTATNGTLVFVAGATNQSLTVPILNDGLNEITEWFRVKLSNPTNATLGSPNIASVQVLDNDTGLRFEFGDYQVDEVAGLVMIGVARGDDGNFPVSVDYVTTDGTATNGLNYLGATNTLFFAAGDKLKTVILSILNDGLQQASRTFSLTLRNPTNQVQGTPSTATVTITHDQGRVQFQPFNQYWIGENEGALTLTVARGNDGKLAPFTVDFAITDLTATNGVDYAGTNGMLHFAQGELVKTLTVPILYDEVPEADKKFKVTLSKPANGTLLGSNNTATITLLDTTGMKPHRFDGIAVLPDRSVRLTLSGGVSSRFQDYDDLYPIEVSSNLVDWTPLLTLQRANSSTNALTYTDLPATNGATRFYRTPGTNLITPLMQPTGPFPVGVVSRLVTDPSRRNRYGISTNGSFMVSIWYPAVATAGIPPARLMDALLARDPGAGAGDAAGGLMDRRACVVSYALPDVPCALNQASYPIVLYSHGTTAVRSDVAEEAANLASHAYVVVSMDHRDAYGTVFPDGAYLHGDTSSFTAAGFQDRVKDLLFTLDELVRWNSSDPAFAGRLDLSRVATVGLHWGAGVAGEIGRIDERIKAVVLLDAELQNADDLVRDGLSKPFLEMYNTEFGGDSTLFNHRAAQTAIWFMITSRHRQWTAFYWQVFPSDLNGGREVNRTIHAYTLWFLNKYLKGEVGPALPLPGFPRVINFRQK